MNPSSLNRNLKAACAAAAVATSWGASQQSHAAVLTGLSTSITPTTHGLTHVYLFYATSSSGYDQVFALPDAPAGQTTSYYVDVNLTGSAESYVIMGVYDEVNGLVSISLGNVNAVGLSFDAVFDDSIDYNEQDIANALIADNPSVRFIDGTPKNLANVLTFTYGTYGVIAPQTGTTGTLISFSDGAVDGSASAIEAIPEPGGAALLGIGGLVFLFRRRAK